MTPRRTILGLLGVGLATAGVIRARLTFGLLPERLTLIFDGSCDFCTRTVRFFRALDRHDRLTIVPFQKLGLPESHGLTVAQCEQSIRAITPDGFSYSAAAAANLTIATALGSAVPLWLYEIPLVTALQERAYHGVAAIRRYIPGDEPYCAQHPDECGQA
jgi:predicted DCC family thiol-disulfide oxidoreductase YuxK